VPVDHQESLVKYCTSETGLKILSTQTLRWSAPHLFSDPFELDHTTKLSFDPHILLQASIKMATAMIFAKEAPRGKSPLANAVRRWREEERFASPDEAEDVLSELLSPLIDQRQASIDKVMTDWRKFTRTLRICSFSAKPDNLASWQQYADNHRGIALRFKCGEFTALPTPKQVEYKNMQQEISTLKDQLDVIMNNNPLTEQNHFYEKFTTRPSIHSPTQEWRCFQQVEEDLNSSNAADDTWFKDTKFERGEITAIYFGIFTDPQIKREIYALVKSKYSEAKNFQARTVAGKCEIGFDRITSSKPG